MDAALIFLIPLHILATTIFFSFPISAMALSQLPQFFFLPLFRQWYCRNSFCLGGCSKYECTQGKPNDGEKKIGNCGNAIAEIGKEKKIVVAKIWGGIKKISVTPTIFLQHFHNKSHVISYY